LKICVTAKDGSVDAPAEPTFGRSPYFVIFDEESNEVSSIKNPFADAAGGVGPKAVQLLIDNKVDILITGQMGGNAQRAMGASKISVYQFRESGTVSDAIARFRANELERML
jgi:predicted Fe-Mo cluster-binding NifX family protein